MTLRRIVLVLLLLLPGLIGVMIFGYVALNDWGALQIAYAKYAAVAKGGSVAALTVAYNAQAIHRINLFADGVWTLLAAVLAGIGVHGLCVMPVTQPNE